MLMINVALTIRCARRSRYAPGRGEGWQSRVTALGRVVRSNRRPDQHRRAGRSAGVDCSGPRGQHQVLIDSLVSAGTVKADERAAPEST